MVYTQPFEDVLEALFANFFAESQTVLIFRVEYFVTTVLAFHTSTVITKIENL